MPRPSRMTSMNMMKVNDRDSQICVGTAQSLRAPFPPSVRKVNDRPISRSDIHVSAKFLGADDYRLDPSHNPPYSKSDDVEANERVEVQIDEHLLLLLNIGIKTGSIKDNS